MSHTQPHRKQVKHYHEPGDFQLTFSCCRRMKGLTNDSWRDHLARRIETATAKEEFLLIAFGSMPEHVHWLVYPTRPEADAECISRFLKGSGPCSASVKGDFASGSRLLQRLTVRERPGRSVFRFWQEGPGYDRNLNTAKAVLAASDYIHLNPVRCGLVTEATAWRWSSARWFLSDGKIFDPMLPGSIHCRPNCGWAEAHACTMVRSDVIRETATRPPIADTE